MKNLKGTVLIGLGIFIGLALFIGLIVMGQFNGLVSERNKVDTQWSQVETQYQRRFDLIPNLVEATKGIFSQEQEVFGKIAEARTRYAGAPAGSPEKVEASNQVESALARLLVVMENYPQLKSSETVRDLMTELSGTENRVGVARQRYNEEVLVYNTQVQQFPGSLFAGMFGFEKRPFFESDKGAESAPKVDLKLK